MIELLIAMSLVTVLLVSLGFGMRATMQTYDENDRLAQVTQSARVVLTRMATEIRTAQSVETDIVKTPPVGGEEGEIIRASIIIVPPETSGPAGTPKVTQIEYIFEDGTLTYKQTTQAPAADPATTESVLIGADEDVHITCFRMAEDTDLDADGNEAVVNVVVSMQITCGNVVNNHTITVAPRRAQRY